MYDVILVLRKEIRTLLYHFRPLKPLPYSGSQPHLYPAPPPFTQGFSKATSIGFPVTAVRSKRRVTGLHVHDEIHGEPSPSQVPHQKARQNPPKSSSYAVKAFGSTRVSPQPFQHGKTSNRPVIPATGIYPEPSVDSNMVNRGEACREKRAATKKNGKGTDREIKTDKARIPGIHRGHTGDRSHLRRRVTGHPPTLSQQIRPSPKRRLNNNNSKAFHKSPRQGRAEDRPSQRTRAPRPRRYRTKATSCPNGQW